MRVKNKNIILAIIQALSLLLLFLPFVYTEEVWIDISGRGGHYQLVQEENVSFFDKLSYLKNGQFLGILFVALMVVSMILLIIQIAKRNNISTVPSMAFVSAALFFFYSLTCTTDPWEGGWGPASYREYPAAFGFVLIFVLQLAIVLIGFICNARVNQNGIIEEDDMRPLAKNNLSNADELAKYKELYDRGVITKEEFEAKKKQLLGL